MSTYYVGAGTKLSAGLQSNYYSNSGIAVNTPINITSVTLDPSVEKGSEESLLASKVKDSSYLLSIGMEGSFSANLRPETIVSADDIQNNKTGWLFSAALQKLGVKDAEDIEFDGRDYSVYHYTLPAAGSEPLSSTLCLNRNGNLDATYPAMVIRSMTLTCPNNDFVTVDVDLVGREELTATRGNKIEADSANYVHVNESAPAFTKSGYIVTNGVFKWNGDEASDMWCIESCTITLDNGIEDSPRCYQDKQYANKPVMGRRAVSVEISLPYDEKIEALKNNFLLENATAEAHLSFTSAEDPNEVVTINMPAVSITSVGAGISGTGVIESTISGELIQPKDGSEPFEIIVQTYHQEHQS